jgi:formate dehydrogenase (coenzyme F420) beta subunit
MNMNEQLKNKITELLAAKTIKGFLGLRSRWGHIGPHLFTTEAELDSLVIGDYKSPGDSRYPLNKFLINIACKYPDDTFGVLVRGCDERGLKALYTWNQLNPNKVVAVGIACPQELAGACECLKPYPDEFVEGQKATACEQKTVSSIDALSVADRYALWIKEFSKCIKCYGCRDVCPMCFCNECSVGSDDLIHTGHIPPEMPIFHLTRAVHMIGRCIDCGLCNEACPADIPLRTLYKKVADIIDKEFQYRPGYTDQKSPLNVL